MTPDVLNRKRAHKAVRLAVMRGLLPVVSSQACVDCGGQAAEWDHHLGYAPEHRLSVQPRCRTCHKRRHARTYRENWSGTCLSCGAELRAREIGLLPKYCSLKCSHDYHNGLLGQRRAEARCQSRTCPSCGVAFVSTWVSQKKCQPDCGKQACMHQYAIDHPDTRRRGVDRPRYDSVKARAYYAKKKAQQQTTGAA